MGGETDTCRTVDRSSPAWKSGRRLLTASRDFVPTTRYSIVHSDVMVGRRRQRRGREVCTRCWAVERSRSHLELAKAHVVDGVGGRRKDSRNFPRPRTQTQNPFAPRCTHWLTPHSRRIATVDSRAPWDTQKFIFKFQREFAPSYIVWPKTKLQQDVLFTATVHRPLYLFWSIFWIAPWIT